MKLKWINKRLTFEDAIKKFKNVEKKLDECKRELELIRFHMQLR